MPVFTLAVQRLVTTPKARWSLLIALLFVGVAVGFRGVLWPGRPAPFVVLHQPWKMPADVQRKLGVILGKTYPFQRVDHAWARERALKAYASVKDAR